MQRKKSTLPDAGKGLFTKHKILKNELIVYIHNPREISTENDLDKLEYNDSAINVIIIKNIKNKNRRVRVWVTDQKNVKTQNWYYLNHKANNPNTIMKLFTTSKNMQTIGWFAKRDINIGEELFFNYNPGSNVRFS